MMQAGAGAHGQELMTALWCRAARACACRDLAALEETLAAFDGSAAATAVAAAAVAGPQMGCDVSQQAAAAGAAAQDEMDEVPQEWVGEDAATSSSSSEHGSGR